MKESDSFGMINIAYYSKEPRFIYIIPTAPVSDCL